MNYTKLNKIQGRWHYNHSNSHTVTPSKPTPSSNLQPNQNPEPNHTSLTGLLPPSSEKVSTVVGHPPTHRQRRSYQMSRQRAAAEARHIHTHPSIHTKQRRLEVHRETHMMRREKGGLATVPPATLLYKTSRRRVRSCELGIGRFSGLIGVSCGMPLCQKLDGAIAVNCCSRLAWSGLAAPGTGCGNPSARVHGREVYGGIRRREGIKSDKMPVSGR